MKTILRMVHMTMAGVVMLAACSDSGGMSVTPDGSAGGVSNGGIGGQAVGGNAAGSGGQVAGGMGGVAGGGGGVGGGANGGGGGALFSFPPAPALTFTRIDESNSYDAVWAMSAQEVYAVGRGGRIRHLRDGNWATEVSGTGSDLKSIWATSATDIHVGTLSNSVLHSKGDGKWEKTVFSFTGSFDSIWASSPTDIYAAGSNVAHFRNGVWVNEDDGVLSALTMVWGLDAQHVWVGAALGILLSSKGDGKWSAEALGATRTVHGMWGDALGNLFVAADDGLFHKGKNGKWIKVSGPGDNYGLREVNSAPAAPLYMLSQGHCFSLNGGRLELVSQQEFFVARNIAIVSASEVWIAGGGLWLGRAK